MSDKKTTYLYSSVSPAQKNRLFAAYKDYIVLMRNLEQVVKRYKKNNLAAYELTRLFGKDAQTNPWQMEYKEQTDHAHYASFLANKPADKSKHYCYVSLNCTAQKFDNLGQGIIAVPNDFIVQSEGNAFPCRVERYIAAFAPNETLKDAVFNISGNYMLTYHPNPDDPILLKDAFANEKFEKTFAAMLDIISMLPLKKNELDKQELINIQNEALASRLTAPFENIILSALASLAEETDKTLKQIIIKHNKDYLYQAQNQGLINSATLIQDTLNIRHLMHHQWDTLDGVGKFNDTESQKNISIRRRFLDSYCRLCDKPLKERIDGYITMAGNFVPLISELVSEFIIRQPGQSNSKFAQQIKEAQKNHERLYVEANYNYGEDKKKSLLKTLSKISPNAELIDNTSMDIDTFLSRISNCLFRRHYIEVFSHIDYKICRYCLLSGKNLTAPYAWEYCRTKKILSPDEVKQWNEFKKLRNDLSHNYLNDKLNQRVQEMLPVFLRAAVLLEDKIDNLTPKAVLIKDNIYQIKHPNGLIVTIDYNNQKVLSVITPKGREVNKKHLEKKTASKSYTEEYAGNAAITVLDNKITSLRLANGLELDLKRRHLTYPDGTKLYFPANDKYFLTAPENAKIALSSKLEVLNYLKNGKSITLDKNEEVAITANHRLSIGKDGCLKEEKWTDANQNKQKNIYTRKEDTLNIAFSTGLKLEIAKKSIEVSFNAQKLSYQNRKAFIEATSNQTQTALIKKQNEGR
ncbi:MAG: hypothetical protein J6J35_01225 [Alphaproteobacteria bacterium]|nr:hypothetical protein [Alphaproteobacteria bacterium]